MDGVHSLVVDAATVGGRVLVRVELRGSVGGLVAENKILIILYKVDKRHYSICT